MSKSIKHSVTVDGKEFTRKSPRTYTHAVIARTSKENLVKASTNEKAKANFLREWDYLTGGWRRWQDQNSPETNAHHAAKEEECKALGKDGAWAKEVARIIASADAKEYRRAVMGWSQSPENAMKMANKYRGFTHWTDKSLPVYVEVEVIPVNRAE
jgi:hypothetical protein